MHALASIAAAPGAAEPAGAAGAVLVRLGDSGWRALLAALGGGVARNVMPALATVLERVEPNVYRVSAEGRTALLPSREPLSAGMLVRFARVDMNPAGTPAATPAPAPGADLSAVARALSTVATAGAGATAGNAAAARSALPLSVAGAPSGGPALPAQWAVQFGAAVSASGLFYEAHLAQWVQGKRSLSAVREEARVRADVERLMAADPARAPAAAAATVTAGAGAAVPDLGLWITQQLAALVTGQAPFRFTAWPGQDAEVVFDDGSARGPREAGVAYARLLLELPNLGPVEARLRADNGAISVTLVAPTEGARARLARGLPALGTQFEAAGLRAGATEVIDDPA